MSFFLSFDESRSFNILIFEILLYLVGLSSTKLNPVVTSLMLPVSKTFVELKQNCVLDGGWSRSETRGNMQSNSEKHCRRDVGCVLGKTQRGRIAILTLPNPLGVM